MKKRTEAIFKIITAQIIVGAIIFSFNTFYGAFFMLGGAFMGLLYEIFKMVRKR